MRTCWRERAEYVQQAGVCMQRMQKALTEMNLQLTTVLSDLSGVTGMNIIRSIVAGERDGMRLAEFREPGCKASKETIAKSLEGTWLPEQLAILKRQLVDQRRRSMARLILDKSNRGAALVVGGHVQKQMAACDLDSQVLMRKMPGAEAEPAPLPTADTNTGKPKRGGKKKASKNQPNFDLAGELKRVAGVDLTRIDGIKTMTVQTIMPEAGLDMSKWPTEDHFVSWIGFAPRNDVSGGKVLKKKTRKVKSMEYGEPTDAPRS